MIQKLVLIIISIALPSLTYARQSDATTALALQEQGKYRESIDLLIKHLGENSKESPQYANLLSVAYTQLSKFDSALMMAELAQNLAVAESNASIEALCAKGFAYLHKGRTDIALPLFEEALLKSQKKTDNQILISQCLSYIGLVHWEQHEINLALDYHTQALSLRKAVYGKEHPLLAASYNDLGLLFAGSDPAQALQYYERALQVYESIYEASHPKIGNAFINIGNAYLHQGEEAKAIENFEKALKIAPKGQISEGFAFSSLANAYAQDKQWDKALSFYEKALENHKQHYGLKHPEIARLYNFIGAVYGNKGQYDKAIQYYQQAIGVNIRQFEEKDWGANPATEEYANPILLINTLLLKSEALEAHYYNKSLKFKHLIYALSSVEACDRVLQKARQERSSKADQLALGQYASELYAHGIKLCLAIALVTPNPVPYRQKAFEFSEKSKAAVLLASISDTKAKQFANIPVTLLEEEKGLQASITALEQQVAASAPEGEAQQQLFEARKKLVLFTQLLEKQYPDYYNLKYNISVATTSQIQAKLQEAQAMISYFVGEERIYIFRIDKKRLDVWDLPVHSEFERWLIGFQSGIAFQIDAARAEMGLLLAKTLLPAGSVKKDEHLLIVPDGKLGQLPFEALPYKKIPYLMQQHAISYAYSGTLFVQQEASNPLKTGPSMLLMAPVEFSGEGVRAFMSSLPGTEQEIQGIAAICEKQGIKADIYLQQAAKESVLTSENLQNYQFVHLATHGVVNEEFPALSQIFLAATDNEAGDLFSGEIYMLKLKADLVSLSACETGLGKITKGEGMIGLSRALIYAGAKNLMVSLWSVSDESTSLLMQEFYRQVLEEKRNYAQALQMAKQKLLTYPEYSSPHYWAPFILIGQ